jgi:uroporphyrinogen decarboxylase
MNAREKFLSLMSFEKGAPIPKWEYGYWAGVVRQWYQAGLPENIGIPEDLHGGEAIRAEVMGAKPGGYVDQDIHKFFEMDNGFKRVPLDNFMCPPYETKILEDHGDWILWQNSFGITVRQMKDRSSLEAFIDSPVTDMDDWERIKEERFSLNLEERLPTNWKSLIEDYKQRDYPLILGGGQGFYGSPRYLIGDERILRYSIKKPELILAINEHLCELWLELYAEVLKYVKPDMFRIWEDMCYKSGPLISPNMFDKFMLPFYKRLTGLVRDCGVKIIFVDTDGNFWKLIPSFIEGGVTGIFPVEVAANMEMTELRKAYPELQLMGGVDKRELFNAPEQIDHYLEERIFPVLGEGGFVPTVDHLVPSDTPWDKFVHYRKTLNQKIDEMNSNNS